MPGSAFGSIDAQLSAAADYGPWNPLWFDRLSASNSAALATCGGLSAARFPTSLTVPTPSAPLTGVAFTHARGAISQVGGLIVGIEFKLGHFVIGTGFTQDVSMSSRWVKGATIQLAASLLFAVCDTAITGTSTLTVTYTNQDGTASQVTGSIVLPAAATLGSAFLISPHLASGDTGIRAVTSMSNSGATAGTISIRGLLPLAVASEGSGGSMGCSNVDPMMLSMVNIPAVAGDTIASYLLGSSGSVLDMMGHLVGVGDI